MASPLMIMIGIHYWTTPGDYSGGEGPHWESKCVQGLLSDFVSGGLLRRVNEPRPGRQLAEYESTEALGVWVDGLCKVPWPVQKWVLPPAFYGDLTNGGPVPWCGPAIPAGAQITTGMSESGIG